MDSFRGQGGIQMLLNAEQEAQHIVSSARNRMNFFLFFSLFLFFPPTTTTLIIHMFSWIDSLDDNSFHLYVRVCICIVKMARLKQAKDEAEKEVTLYKSHLETECQKRISEVDSEWFIIFKTFYYWIVPLPFKPFFFFFFFNTHIGFFVLQTSGSSESTVKRLEEETEIKIKQLKDSALKVSKEVTDLLIKYITTIKNWWLMHSTRRFYFLSLFNFWVIGPLGWLIS